MLLGRSEAGKTSLLNQLRQEGQVPKGSLQTDNWSARLGYPTKASSKTGSTSTPKFGNLVDVSEWNYEPSRSSTKSISSISKTDGPVTFRTWDFDRLQKDFQQVPHYFLTRRSICLIVWKVTDGEIALNEIHEWLLAIHVSL
jgi:GTPase SAR1 family protein